MIHCLSTINLIFLYLFGMALGYFLKSQFIENKSSQTKSKEKKQ